MKRLQRIFKCGIVRERTPTAAGTACFEWHVQRHDQVREILKRLLPHMTTKKRQAFLALKHLTARHTHPGVPYSRKELYEQRRTSSALNRLNRSWS